MEMKLGMRSRGSYQFGDVSLPELAQKWPATRGILRRKLGSLPRAISKSNMRKQRPQTLLTGGKPLGNKGYYIEPTIFTDVKDNMLIAQDEIFGPVMALMKFKTIEEAIQRDNTTRYGLAAAIITEDLNVANTVSRSIRAGIIWINCYFAFDRDCPYGGHKMSGFGRDFGMQALYKYLHTKSVVTPIYNSPWL